MNIYYYFFNLNQTSISKLLLFLFFFLYSLSLILSLNMFILFLPYLNTLCFSGNWNSVFGPRYRWIWSCRSNTTSQLQLFANTYIFCLYFLQFRFFTWKRRKEILRSLSQVRPKEFTYFLKITFGIVTVHPLPITPLRSLRRNYVLIKQMTVMHIKQITKFCSNKHDINSSFFLCQLAAVDVTKRVERTNARERTHIKKLNKLVWNWNRCYSANKQNRFANLLLKKFIKKKSLFKLALNCMTVLYLNP